MLTLVNIYGPNKDDPSFYENVFKCITEMENDTYIICGDFNLTLDQNMDCFNYKHINNPKARMFVSNKINDNNLFDTFRELHPSLKRYTWCGCLSSFFKLGRGCRQGDPISPYLFILCAEILSVRIRNNKNIKGIKIDNVELKFSQYADDASAFLDGSRRSLEETLQELELFAEISGLKTNFDKTHVVWIGAKKYSTDSIKTRWKLSWGSTQFKLLGIFFNVDLDKIIGLNYDERCFQSFVSISTASER